MKFFKENWFVLLLVAIVAIFVLKECRSNKATIDPNVAAVKYLQESVRVYKNELGQTTAKLNQLVLNNAKQLEEINSKDKRIAELKYAYRKVKKELKKKDEILSITIVELENVMTGGFDTVYIADADTIWVDGGGIVIPKQFKFSYSDEWHILDGVVGANKENSYYNLITKEKLELSYVKKPLGFLGMKGVEYELSAVSLSPYTTDIDLNGFTIHEKPKRFHIGIGAGATLTPKGISPAITLNMMYSFISF